jgi:hypothetical protein
LSGRRRWLRWGLALALPLLALGHWWFWYRPRPHALAPEDSVLLGAARDLPLRLWLPFPHQNLGALETTAEGQEVLSAAARLADLPPPSLPRLGPFGLPPAREMFVAVAEDGETGVAAVRLYPVVAGLSRLAGILASNPWLAGGEVEVDGEPARVRWEGRTWWLERGASAGATDGSGVAGAGAAAGPSSPGDAARPVFALVDLGVPSPPLPAGRYALRRAGDDLVLHLEGAEPAGAAQLREPSPALLMLVRRRDQRDEVLVLFDRAGGPLEGIPAAAAWARPGGAVKLLPGGSLLSRLTGVGTEPLAGGELAGSDVQAMDRARAQAERFVPLATGASAPPIGFGAWLQVRPLARRAREVHGVLESVPFFGDEEAQRWSDVALLLEAASGYGRAVCWLAADGSAGELRLVR